MTKCLIGSLCWSSSLQTTHIVIAQSTGRCCISALLIPQVRAGRARGGKGCVRFRLCVWTSVISVLMSCDLITSQVSTSCLLNRISQSLSETRNLVMQKSHSITHGFHSNSIYAASKFVLAILFPFIVFAVYLILVAIYLFLLPRM